MQVEQTEGIEEVLEEDPVIIPVDFSSLKTINSDIYAWIDIGDTCIHYPIAQHATDDTYYLNHTIEGKKGYPGSIYTEKINAKDFSDYNTVIYGHRMNTATMFNHLHKFNDKEFFDSHDTIMIYTETEIKTYRVYAAVVYDNRHIMYSFDWQNPEGRKEFIQSLRHSTSWKTHFREGMTIDENSRLITLSTCIKNQPNNRYLVIGAEVVEN
ncbi:MAG: class B sortase [Faecalimonas sp.]|nr:class B sortase [Faecalimonas sp.]